MRPTRASGESAAAALLGVSVALLLPLGGGGWRPEHRLGIAVVTALTALTALAAIPAIVATSSRVERLDRRALAALAGVTLLLCDSAVRAWTAPLTGPALERLALDALLGGALVAGMMIAAIEAAFLADVIVAALVVLALAALAAAPDVSSLSWPFAGHASLGATLAAGAVLAFDVPVVSSRASRGTGRRPGPGGASIVRMAASAVLVVAVAASQSRSAMLALGLVLAVVAWRHRRAAGVAILVGIVLALSWVGASGRWDPVGIAGSAPVTDRLVVWRASLALAAEHPWAGSGSGSYGSAIWRFTPDSLGGAVEHAHCAPLEMLVERGAFGLAAIGLVLALLIRGAGSTPLSRRFLAAGLAPLVAGFVDVSLDLPGPALLTALLLGAAVGADSGAGSPAAEPAAASRRGARASRLGPLLAGLVVVLCSLVVVCAHPPRFFRGDDRFDPFAALARAAVLEERGELAAAEEELLRAHALFPLGAAPQEVRIGFLLRRGRLADALALIEEVARAHPSRAARLAIETARSLEHPALAESLAPHAGPDGRREIAQWLAGRGEAAAALRLLSTVPMHDSSDRRALASALAAAGRHPEARAALDPIEDTESRVLLASLATDPASIEAAIDLLAAAPGADDRVARALVGLLDRAGRSAEAAERLDRAIRDLPGSVALHELRADRRATGGDIGGAMEDARRLIELTPRAVGGRLRLARLLERRGMAAGARALYAEALSIAPGDAEAAAGLARLPPASDPR